LKSSLPATAGQGKSGPETGVGWTSRDMLLPQTGLRTCLQVAERNLTEEDAAATLAGIAEGRVARCLLPWIPLMWGGAEAGIIEQWKPLALAEPDARRADYGGLALVFAELTDCRPQWKKALEGWNVEQSRQVLEWQAIAEKRGKVEGKAESVLRVLQRRLGAAVPADLEAAIRGIAEQVQLDRLLDAASVAGSLDEFRRSVNL
jgi:hypothetical protein